MTKEIRIKNHCNSYGFVKSHRMTYKLFAPNLLPTRGINQIHLLKAEH